MRFFPLTVAATRLSLLSALPPALHAAKDKEMRARIVAEIVSFAVLSTSDRCSFETLRVRANLTSSKTVCYKFRFDIVPLLTLMSLRGNYQSWGGIFKDHG